MIFSKDTLAIGGKMVIPDSFIDNKEPCEIVNVTSAGVNVVYRKDTDKAQVAFYGFDWLNQMYGPKKLEYHSGNTSGLSDAHGDLDDDIPWNL